MYTVDEAVQLWCPFARNADTEGVETRGGDVPESINRAWQGEAKANCMCLADGCMAWRWPVPEGCRVHKGHLWKLGPDGKSWERVPDWTPEGYCGLAGRP